MILNIVDKRTRQYRWKVVNAVIEDTTADNSIEDSDQLDEENEAAAYDQRMAISLHEAIKWAESEEGKVTLYIYDEGDGIF